MKLIARCLLSVPLYMLTTTGLFAGDTVTPGELTVDPPTLICLGFHWPIDGDDNGNAVCRIEFRKQGESDWQRGLNLWRTNGETCGTDRWTPPAWQTPNAFGGSLFDLEPGTVYEYRLEIQDPDGVEGEAVRSGTIATRPEPRPAADGRILDIGPEDVRSLPLYQQVSLAEAQPLAEPGGQVFHAFPKDADRQLLGQFENSRNGLLHAYYGYTMYCDWNFDPRRIEPGETIVLHGGEYISNRRDYREKSGYSLWFHGTHFLAQSGTADQPIVIKAAEGEEVVFNGDDCDTLFDITHADYLVLQGITFRNCKIAIKAGDLSRGAKGIRIIDCKFENVEIPLLAANAGCTGYQISGNTVDGQAGDLIDTAEPVGVFTTLAPEDLQPGDIIRLQAGTYRFGSPEDHVLGAIHFPTGGTAEKPIAVVAADGAEVILDGEGTDTLFDVRSTDHIYFEGLTFRNAKITIKAGIQYLNGCTGLTVRNCRFEDVGYGVLGASGECRDFLIADNHMRCWKVNRLEGQGNNQTFDRAYGYGINLLGMGHVACYNDISEFWDNLNVTTNGHGDPAVGRPAIAIDFYNNIAGRAGDNPGEADGSVRNVRFLRNKGSFTCQPIWGGPVYFIRNLGEPTKYAEHPSGVIALHTALGGIFAQGGKHSFVNNHVKWSWKEDLFGLNVDSPPGPINGNAYDLIFKGEARQPEKWVYQLGEDMTEAASFAEFQELTGFEAQGFTFETTDDSALVDKAILLPNVNDDFVGEGPDIGPHEQGKPEPHYGPRSRKNP